MSKVSDRKKNYCNQLLNMTQEYKKILVAECLSVGSSQMQQVRKAVRGKAVIVMGKNTLMRKAFKNSKDSNPKLVNLVPKLKGKICLVFTNGDLKEVRDILNSNKKDAAAKAGQISPFKVVIPAQNTGMEPTKTSFFQALNIPTRITKGAVEITADFTILVPGQKVGSSEAALLGLLSMRPFNYGLNVTDIYDDGTCYTSAVLDTSAADMMKVLEESISKVASLSLGANYPTEASIPSLLTNAFKDILSVSVATMVPFKQSEQVLEYIKNPSKFASQAPKEEPKKEVKKEAPKKEEKKEEPKKEESAGEVGFGLFGEE
jgi:large subunit ribosomal protein LP0